MIKTSSLTNPGRLIIDPPQAGVWNMARDEVLLESAAVQPGITLRFYEWREATVSLGYFQPFADRTSHQPSTNCPIIRRLSGGGAIVHHHDLTYSLVISADDPLAVNPSVLYDGVHQGLVAALATQGVVAQLRPECDGLPASQQPFLCFQRRSTGDVLLGNSKIAGSAARKRRGAILQHGSLLLSNSIASPEMLGVADLTGIQLDTTKLIQAWVGRLENPFRVRFTPATTWSSAEDEKARNLLEKYASLTWTIRR